MSDTLNNSNSDNDTTSNLNKEVISLQSLRDLKARIESNGINITIQNEIDMLTLTSYDNIELQKLKTEILNIYNFLEKNARTFLSFTYSNISEKQKAEYEYREIIKIKDLAQNPTNNLETRKNILNRINTMSYSVKNIGSTLYDIDIACKTYNGQIYKSLNDVSSAMHEGTLLDEFIKIDEILNETREVSAIMNIKNKFKNIKSHNYSNVNIKKRISSISFKLSEIERELKHYDGKHYTSFELVKEAQDEMYYIESEAFKFDLLSKDGLQFFLELMSLREFKSESGKETIEKYRYEFLMLEDKEDEKVIKQDKVSIKKRKKIKFKIAAITQVATLGFLLYSPFTINSIFKLELGLFPPALLIFIVSLPICSGYMIYYKISNGVDSIKNKYFSKKNKNED